MLRLYLLLTRAAIATGQSGTSSNNLPLCIQRDETIQGCDCCSGVDILLKPSPVMSFILANRAESTLLIELQDVAVPDFCFKTTSLNLIMIYKGSRVGQVVSASV
ncbi:unnamed protein product [Nesidiocoris tenuis]|uniref:DUF4773 domain-containing protein n=1 Tax=Nesidiocoris tenuis TaxID=355587 RepID=A0A6H5G1S7_9HEMI|nr:unnamed protein product [Nesidiocoris tenuis]